jgi:hypothetical protein
MDEHDLEHVEAALRAAGPPLDPPAHYAQAARRAALSGPEVVRLDTARSRRRGWQRPLLAVAVIAASTIAALVIGVGGNNMQVERQVPLTAAAGSSASASVDFGKADGPVRPVVLKVSGLPPAPDGTYYEMWMSDGDEQMPVGAFDTASDGTVTAKMTIPSDMGWKRCWVTVADGGRTGDDPVVLHT